MKSIHFRQQKKNQQKKRQRIVIASGLASSIFASSVFAALYGWGPAESWTMNKINTVTAAILQGLESFRFSFHTQTQKNFEQVISAIAVATKQEALAANQIAEGARMAGEQLSNAYSSQKTTEQVAQAYLDFHPSTGQGYDPCGTIARNKTLDSAFDGIAQNAKQTVGKIDVSPGRMVNSTPQAMQDRLKTHRDKFCSEAEAQAGLCTLSELPGGDTNASLLFESAAEGSLKSEARVAYIQHVLGEPDQAINKAAGATPAGKNYMLTKNRKDALLSIPAHSLAMINSANTQSAQLQNKSPNEVLNLRVNQYFGGKEAEAWAGSLATQRPRGLIVEAAKMTGLETWISYKQYEQNQRIEANLAALVLSAAERFSGPLDAQYQKAVADNIHVQIK